MRKPAAVPNIGIGNCYMRDRGGTPLWGTIQDSALLRNLERRSWPSYCVTLTSRLMVHRYDRLSPPRVPSGDHFNVAGTSLIVPDTIRIVGAGALIRFCAPLILFSSRLIILEPSLIASAPPLFDLKHRLIFAKQRLILKKHRLIQAEQRLIETQRRLNSPEQRLIGKEQGLFRLISRKLNPQAWLRASGRAHYRGSAVVFTAGVAAATSPRLTKPFSNCSPHILSQSMNRDMSLPM